MQSQIQMNSRSNPVDTEQLLDSETGTQSEPNAQEDDKLSAPAKSDTVIPLHGNETRMHTAETPASMVIAQDKGNELVVQSVTEPAEMERDAVTKPKAPSEPLSYGNRSKKCDPKDKDKGVRDGKKYIPSKKAMIDPLKIDMSKALVMPLTTSQLSLQCIECHIIFSDPKSKERHLKLSHPAEYEQSILRNALFACYVCDRHFTNSTELKAHQKAHTERKPFKCPICSQAFSKSSELTFHKKIHIGRDGYICTDCGKACKTLTLLKYHRRTHTGERPYVCKDCGKRFSMSKALQRHMESHSSEGDDQDTGDRATAKAQMKTKNGRSTVMYPCSVCEATFKSTKTRLHHMKTKHSVSTTSPNITLPGRKEVKQSTPIITPISICQPALLQVEPNGPLQKVDANIDTEQIRKLIESLGNVQKVNQVVILGQVPPNAPPLEVQQVSEMTQPMTLNLNPPQLDFMGLKQAESKGNELELSNDPMEQTIILEPITPDGQLENPSFSELGSHIAAGESIELTLVDSDQTQRPVAEVMHQILQQPEMGAVQSDAMNQVVCHNEVVELKENMEQTIILELTSTLTPTVELEQSQNVSQTEISSSLVPTTELEKTPDQAAISEQETSLSVQSLMSTVELELTPLQTEQQGLSACSFVPPDTFTQTPNESKTKAKGESVSQIQQERVDKLRSKTDGTEARQGSTTHQAPPEIILIDHGEIQEQVEILSKVDNPSAKEDVTSQIEVKEVQQTSEVPINTMSAQELVKVRKRKPAKAFIFQGYMQELAGSIPNDVSPTKRQRTKKSHLVVKFGPQSKEKKNQKQKHQSSQEAVLSVKTPTVNMSEKKVTSQKNKGRKGKREKVEDAVSTAETKSPPAKDRHQRIKEDARKNKVKKKDGAKEGVVHISEVSSPVFKKKQQKIMQKGKAKTVKDGKVTTKGKKKGLAREKKTNAKTDSSGISGAHIIPDSLLLLKGHKQPQLKVHKLDPSKATGQTQEVSTNESQTSQSKGKSVRRMSKESAGNLAKDDKKNGGRSKKNQKALSLLSSLQVFRQPTETLPKPKSTRKRKASSKVEMEGVITSKRALECKDCGERFSEVSFLQKHKTTVHIVESPGLTYTNGNVFEGVSRLDIYQLPKQSNKVVGVMNASTGWDTEPEMGETDRDRSVSFPALNLSPSSPVHPSDLFLSGYEDKGGNQTGTDGLSHEPPKVLSPSETPLTISTKTQNLELLESLESEKDKNPSTDSEVQATADEDMKDDLLLDIDLVTVGGQNEIDDPSSCQDSISQNELHLMDENTDLSPAEAENKTTEKTLVFQTVSCSTNQVEVKEEEEEMLVQKQKDEGKGALTKSLGSSRRRGAGRLKKGLISKRVLVEDTPRETDPEREQDDCEVVYEKPSVPSNSEMNCDETHRAFTHSTLQTLLSHKEAAPVSSLPSVPSLTQKTLAEQDDVESGSTRAAEVSERGLQEHEREAGQSPGIILEKFVTSKQRATSDNHLQVSNNNAGNEVLYSEEIKVEEIISDVPTCQSRQSSSVQPHHRDVRTILVKEERSLVLNDSQFTSGSRHIRWNVEVNTENSTSPLMQSGGETTDSSVAPDFNTNQCIFYPVKEEEREVLLGAAQANTGCGSPGDSSSTHHTDHQRPDSNLHKGSYDAQEYQETRVRGMSSEAGVDDFSDGQAELDAECQQTSDIRDFLLQSSDEEDVSAPALCDPQLDSEAEVMAYFYKKQNTCLQQPHETTQSLGTSTNPLQPPVETSTREPIEYFSAYFSWDYWVDISHCTNKLSSMSSPVSAKEVAQFIGIHIAMGTLKFPSPRLYWEDLTKVPLIASAMPQSRFLELSRMLKLASPVMDTVNSNSTEETTLDFHNKLQATFHSSTAGICKERTLPEDSQRSNENLKTLQSDPLWKVQPLLHRFLAGCRSLKRESDYAVDQYPLPLTGKMCSNNPSLHCTTLIGFGGLLSHVDLKLDLSDKEDTVEKIAPKGSTVFLCKQELSTPVMLERLLMAGVHGAGRVGGARGQIGDEFVSSDGKLMLRRSHCGFILSTAGNCQRNMVSLSDSFEKAQKSARLNKDLQNLYSIPITASSPTSWPQAVLWYLTDLALVNSWLQYRQDHRAAATTLTLLAFRLEVSKALILSSGTDTQDSVPPQPPTENAHTTNETPNPSLVEESPLPDVSTRYDGSGHWPEQLGEGEGGRCRFGDCQRTSRVLCLKCCVFLCISKNHNCFLNFHSQGSLGKKS